MNGLLWLAISSVYRELEIVVNIPYIIIRCFFIQSYNLPYCHLFSRDFSRFSKNREIKDPRKRIFDVSNVF